MKNNFLPVSVVIPMKNSATTILSTLDSIANQKYPVKEIVIIDNVSSDNSIEIVETYKQRSKIRIYLIKRKENKGVGASYNLGVKKSSSSHVILMHSDSSLSTKHEIKKLIQPFIKDKDVVATYPKVVLPQKVWQNYNFWQKCMFARTVGLEIAGFNGKFDCIKRETFLKIGGFDDENFGEDIGIGGEDADLYLRLQKEGKLVLSTAKVIHLHYLGKDYKLTNWIKNRRLLARTYGRLIRVQGARLPIRTHGKGLSIPLGVLIFLVKPTLALLPFIPGFHVAGLVILFAYTFMNSRKMYTDPLVRRDFKIILLPFIDIYLLYAESYWMLEAFIKRGV